MDPSIVKLLEEDEDETMHSGADVEAFTAALNRDIEGDASNSQPSDSDSAALSQGSNHTSSQLFPHWQTSRLDENSNSQNQQDLNGSRQQDQRSSEMELKKNGPGTENQQQSIDTSQELNRLYLQHKQPQDDHQQRQAEQNTLQLSQTPGIHNSEKNPVHIREPDRTNNPESEAQYQKIQRLTTQQAMNAMNRGKQVPFALLLPVIQPQLDKDRAMQLQTLYLKLKKNEIPKDGFVRHMRAIVGDQMLKMAVFKLQEQAARNTQTGPNLQSQASAQLQHPKVPPVGVHQVQLKTDSSNAMMGTNGQKSREIERLSDSHGMPASQMPSSSLSNINQERERPTIPIQGLSKQQQQHLHFSQSSFPIHGSAGNNYHPFPGTNINAPATSLKQQPHDSQMRQGPVYQSIGVTQKNSVHWQSSISKEQKNGAPSSVAYVKQEPVDQGNEQQHKSQLSSPQGLSSFSPLQVERGNATGTLKDEALETQSSRIGFSASASVVPPSAASSSMTTQLDASISLSSRIPSGMSPLGLGNNAKAPTPKKPSVGQKKPLECSSPPLPSKKQKVSGAFLDQSIEQLNDVTAVSGVNLREEEEQLFSGPKEDSRVSEASRRVVQEEEEKLILQKIPLQKKLAEIMTKCGLKSVSNDVERCLSLCVEERMRGLISNLIRLSKQRVDIEKPRHRTLITSDVRQQIVAMNRKAREEWEKKQAEADKLQKLNEPEASAGVDGDKEKDDGRMKSVKANKEEDDKMRTTAANVAARAAVGGDDMLSKWQLMAEQARQKREGGIDATPGSQPGKDVNRKSSSTSGKSAKDSQEGEKRGLSVAAATSGSSRKFVRNHVVVPQTRIARTISIKDVVAVLEREPQMSKSTVIYRLYEKMHADAVAE